jgi:hypothetical protein
VFFELDYSRISSRFTEYVFQWLRCSDRTSSVFGCMEGEQLLNNLLAQLVLEFGTAVFFPDSKRGAPRGTARAHSPKV